MTINLIEAETLLKAVTSDMILIRERLKSRQNPIGETDKMIKESMELRLKRDQEVYSRLLSWIDPND